MDKLGNLLTNFTQKKTIAKSERDELVRKFHSVDSIKIVEKKQLVSPDLGTLALLLRNFKTKELYALYKQCSEAKNFAKCFWYLVKQRNEEVKTARTKK